MTAVPLSFRFDMRRWLWAIYSSIDACNGPTHSVHSAATTDRKRLGSCAEAHDHRGASGPAGLGRYAPLGLRVSISFFEIYGAELFDLLRSRQKLVVRRAAALARTGLLPCAR